MKGFKAKIIISTIAMSVTLLFMAVLVFLYMKYAQGGFDDATFYSYFASHFYVFSSIFLAQLLAIFIFFTYQRVQLFRQEIAQGESIHDAQTQQMLAGFAGDFVFLSYVDFKTGVVQILKDDLGDEYARVVEELAVEESMWERYETRIQFYCDYHVCAEDRERFRSETSKESVLENLKHNKAYFVNHRRMIDGKRYYHQMKYIAVAPDKPNLILVGCHNIDEEHRRDMKITDELREAVERAEDMARNEAIYRDAIFAKANSYYQVNLTRDIVVSPIWEVVNGQPVDYSQKFGGPYPRYSDIIEKAADRYVTEDYKEYYRKYLSRDYLLQCYNEGKMISEYVCRINSSQIGNHFRKYTQYFSVDAKSEDVMVMCVATDVSNEFGQEIVLRECIDKIQQQKDNDTVIQEILQVLGEYYGADRTGVYIIDAMEDITRKVYEWNAPGITPMIPQYACMPIAPQRKLLRLLEEANYYQEEAENMMAQMTEPRREVFEYGNVLNVMSVPIWSGNEMVGFLSLDNTKQNKDDLFLLTAVSALTYAEIIRREENRQDTAIMKTLSQDYETMYYVNLDDGTYIVHSRRPDSDWLNRNFDANKSDFFREIASYIDVVVYEPDRKMLTEFLSRENLLKRFETESVLKKDYRLFDEDEPVYHTLKIVHTKARTGNGGMVIGVSNIDTDTRNRYALLDELAESREQAEKANQAKSEFLSKMSHDIRTPINAVMGMTAVANLSIHDADKVRDCLHKIDGASQHLLDLINEVLDMSQIESGKIAIYHNPLNLRTLCDNCRSIIEGQLAGRDMTFDVDLSEVIHERLIGDELHMRQILINILGNAVKFTPAGGKINFRVKEQYSNDNYAGFLFEIEDTGRGMDEEYVSTIFEPFSQEEKDARSTYSGTGLGMSITKNLVSLLQGEIKVTSKKGVGTRFTVELPIEIDHSEAVEDPAENEHDLTGVKALVVEDNELNAEIVMTIFASQGIECRHAANGQVAVEMFEQSAVGEYDIIFMDIMMPVMDGIRASSEVRKMSRPDAVSIPIIAMTANAFEEDRQRSYAAGMNEHISKPISPKVLKSTMAKYINRQE